MKIRDVISENVSTTSGSIATVSAPLGSSPIRRNVDSFFSGKYTTDADPYPNTPEYMKKKKGKNRVS
jgi:hypothetical protein